MTSSIENVPHWRVPSVGAILIVLVFMPHLFSNSPYVNAGWVSNLIFFCVMRCITVIAIPLSFNDDHGKRAFASKRKTFTDAHTLHRRLLSWNYDCLKSWLKMSLEEILIKNLMIKQILCCWDGRQAAASGEKMNRLSMMRKGKEKRVEFATKEHTEKKNHAKALLLLRCCFYNLIIK